jgi:serine/threonine protein kinase
LADWDRQKYGGWDKVSDLGEGGQGKVYLVRSPEGTTRLIEANSRIQVSIRAANSIHPEPWKPARDLARAISDLTKAEDDQTVLGALKAFKKADDPKEQERAQRRFENEVNALSSVKHASLV